MQTEFIDAQLESAGPGEGGQRAPFNPGSPELLDAKGVCALLGGSKPINAATLWGPRTRVMHRIKKLLPVAKAFQEQHCSAVDAAGLPAAVEVVRDTAAALHVLCDDALRLDASTKMGLVILADAVDAECECADDSPYSNSLKYSHAPRFARSLRRVLGSNQEGWAA